MESELRRGQTQAPGGGAESGQAQAPGGGAESEFWFLQLGSLGIFVHTREYTPHFVTAKKERNIRWALLIETAYYSRL